MANKLPSRIRASQIWSTIGFPYEYGRYPRHYTAYFLTGTKHYRILNFCFRRRRHRRRRRLEGVIAFKKLIPAPIDFPVIIQDHIQETNGPHQPAQQVQFFLDHIGIVFFKFPFDHVAFLSAPKPIFFRMEAISKALRDRRSMSAAPPLK